MISIKTLFFDIGGVLLTNGWDVHDRQNASEIFKLNPDEFEQKHKEVVDDFECGRISIDEYLNRTVFYEGRNFSDTDFISFMEERSKPIKNNLDVVAQLVKKNCYKIFALNNESFELNLFRIRKFHLNKYFDSFFSSCFLGFKKPGKKIFEIALNVTQNKPQDCVFIDDREENIKTAEVLGFHSIHFTYEDNLSEQLISNGIK